MFLFFSWEKEIDNLASPHLYFEMDIDTSSGLELTLVYIFFFKRTQNDWIPQNKSGQKTVRDIGTKVISKFKYP